MLLQLASLFAAISAFLAVPHPALSIHHTVAAPTRPLPELSATSVFLVDTTDGAILHAKNPDAIHPIASITKLMTALTLLDKQPDWNRLLTFEAGDRRNGGIAYIVPGEEIRTVDAWNLMLVASSNDAAALLTRELFGSEAAGVAAMNAKAKALGLRSIKFVDPTGLRPENVGTAREVAALARLSLSYGEIRQATLKSAFEFTPQGKAPRQVAATDQLLRWFRPPSGDLLGGKTGHIEESRYNLVFAARSFGREFIAVVLGSESNDTRFQDMAKLLQWGFSAAKEAQALGG